MATKVILRFKRKNTRGTLKYIQASEWFHGVVIKNFPSNGNGPLSQFVPWNELLLESFVISTCNNHLQLLLVIFNV